VRGGTSTRKFFRGDQTSKIVYKSMSDRLYGELSTFQFCVTRFGRAEGFLQKSRNSPIQMGFCIEPPLTGAGCRGVSS